MKYLEKDVIVDLAANRISKEHLREILKKLLKIS